MSRPRIRPIKHIRAGRLVPLLRWAGGKQPLAAKLVSYLPSDAPDRVYHEPFVGAASMYFLVQPVVAHLSDANEHIINCHTHVRDNPEAVATHLRQLARRDSAIHYYQVRQEYNSGRNSPRQVARFIYLNRTSFNGIFRVNVSGHYNVPYGHKPSPTFPSLEHLREASNALGSATLTVSDFRVALAAVEAGGFVYLDPPYPPLNGTSYFCHYTPDRFDAESQNAVAVEFRRLHELGALVMMSNADTPLIRRLYSGFNLHRVPVTRYITCKSEKRSVNELVVTNYPRPE